MHLNCRHTWCNICLNVLVNRGIRNRGFWPPTCCKPIDINDLRPILDDNVVRVLDQNIDELQSDNPVYCHVAKCSKFILVDKGSDQGQFVRCPECHAFTCVECKAAKDKHVQPLLECPDLITEEDKELAKKEGWKQCPNKRCQRLIERPEGCQFMICACGTYFCYDCGSQVENGTCSCLLPNLSDP